MAPLNAHRHRRHDDAIIPSMPWLSRLHDDEEGMVTWAFLVAILFFLVLGGFVFNAGNTINRKIETQNAADAATYSGTVWVAAA